MQLETLKSVPSISGAELLYVSSALDMRIMASILEKHAVFSIDVEHSPASYHGFVACVQISCAGSDFIVDTMIPEVRAHFGPVLARFLSSSRRTKILFHGVNDVKWLHSNFGVSITSPVLDAAVAARLTGETNAKSLAALVKLHLGATLDKRLQTADWRRRPLPDNMLAYARADSHYLLPLAHILARRMSEESPASDPHALLREALEQSHTATLHRYDAASAERFKPATFVAMALRQWDAVDTAASVPTAFAVVHLARWRHSVALSSDVNVDMVLDSESLVQAGVSVAALETPHVDSVAATLEAYLPTQHAAAAATELSSALLSTPAAGMRSLVQKWSTGAVLALDAGAGADADAPLSAGNGSVASRNAVKEARASRIFVSRATPLYSNIALLAPDCTLLACIDKRKADWYLSVRAVDALDGDGAVLQLDLLDSEEGDDPPAPLEGAADAPAPGGNGNGSSPRKAAAVRPTPLVDAALEALPPGVQLHLRLRQPPKGLGHAGDSFHLTAKHNQCVVCGVTWEGSGGGLNRLYVVPHIYRCQFPLAAKSYQSHDVVLTCCRCHVMADQATAALARAIAREMGVPHSAKEAVELGLIPHPDGDAPELQAARRRAEAGAGSAVSTLKRAGNALFFRRSELPPARVGDLQQLVRRLGWILPLILDDTRQRAEDAARCAGSRPKKKQAAAAGAAAKLLQEVETALAPLISASSPSGTLPASIDFSEAAFRSMGSLRLAEVTERATAVLLSPRAPALCVPLSSADGDDHHAEQHADEPSASESAVRSAAPAAASVIGAVAHPPAPKQPAWDPAERIVRAVMLGPLDPLWTRAEAHYPPAIPAPCAGCEWEAKGIATTVMSADSDGTLKQTGTPDHICDRAHVEEGGEPDGPPGVSGLPLATEDRLTRFVQRWRANFLRRLQPRAMPAGWAVNYRVFTGGIRKRNKEEPQLVQELHALFDARRSECATSTSSPSS